jgi:hypothetical protein
MTLYYSSRSQPCIEILNIVNNSEYLQKKLKVIPIEEKTFPDTLKSVPALYIGNQVYEGKNAFDYCSSKAEYSLDSFDFNSQSFVGTPIEENEDVMGNFAFMHSEGFEENGAHNIDTSEYKEEDKPKSDSILESLIAERNSQIPSAPARV